MSDVDEDLGERKPAKPNADLVSYLMQLVIPLQTAAQIDAQHAMSEESALLIARVFREIRKSEASLSTNKRSSYVLELLLRVASARQLLEFARSVLPYTGYLAHSLYASHVLEQQCLRLHEFISGAIAIEPADTEKDAGAVDAHATLTLTPDEVLAGLFDSLVSFTSECVSRMVSLMASPVGWRVLRTVISVLAGFKSTKAAHDSDVQQHGRQGKDGRNSAKGAVSASTQTEVDAVASKRFFKQLGAARAQQVRACLVRMVHAMLDATAGMPHVATHSLYGLCTDSHACFVIQRLLQASTVATPGIAKLLARRICGWSEDDLSAACVTGEADLGIASDVVDASEAKVKTKHKHRHRHKHEAASSAETMALPSSSSTELLDGLCKDFSGSYIVETVLHEADAALFDSLVSAYFLPNLLDLARHDRANFVVQRLLVHCRTLTQREAAIAVLLPHLAELTSSKRAGVVWHIVEAAARPPAIPPNAPPGLFVQSRLPAAVGAPVSIGVQVAIVQALSRVAGASTPRSPTSHLARWWLDINGYRGTASRDGAAVPDTVMGDKDAIQPARVLSAGANIVAAVLRLEVAAHRPMLDSLLALPFEELLSVANEPFCSRHILEPLLAEATDEFDAARQALFKRFKGHFSALARSRCGCWVMTKLFDRCHIKQKTAVAQELVLHEPLVRSTAAGCSVLRVLRMDQFKYNPGGWTAGWAQMAAKDRVLSDIIRAMPAAPAIDIGGRGGRAMEGVERTNKRKRVALSTPANAEIAATRKEEGSEAVPEKREKREKQIALFASRRPLKAKSKDTAESVPYPAAAASSIKPATSARSKLDPFLAQLGFG